MGFIEDHSNIFNRYTSAKEEFRRTEHFGRSAHPSDIQLSRDEKVKYSLFQNSG